MAAGTISVAGGFAKFLPYTAALMTSAPQGATAEGFIKFLVSPKAEETFAARVT